MRTESKPCFSQNCARWTMFWNGSLAAKKTLHPNLTGFFTVWSPGCSLSESVVPLPHLDHYGFWKMFEVWISGKYLGTFYPGRRRYKSVCERKIFLGFSLLRMNLSRESCCLRVDWWDV